MPQITKQSPQSPTVRKTTKTVSVLDRITPVEEVGRASGIKLCEYGRGKTGKTRLACTFPKPLLLIGTEDGTKSVSTIPGVDFVRIQSSEDFAQLVEYLVSGGRSWWKLDLSKTVCTKWLERVGDPYKSAVLDTAGGLQDIILKEITGVDEIPIQKSWGMAGRDQWMACGAQWKERMRVLLDLSERSGLNVVVIAHERNFNEDSSSSDVMVPSIGAALTPSAAAWLNGACDYICQTYIREQTVMKEGKIGGKPTTLKTLTGKKEYCLRVGPHPVYMTGFRLPDGVLLPDSIVDPSYAKIEKLIRGVKQ